MKYPNMPMIPIGASNSGQGLSAGSTITKMGYTNLDPEHQIRLTIPSSTGDKLVVIGPSPENVALSLQSGYEQMPGVSESADQASGVVGGTMARVTGASNFSSLFLGTSAQTWSGKEYIQLDIPFHYHATSNPRQEVSEITRLLMRYAAPRLLAGGALVPPGVNPQDAFRQVGTGVVDDSFGITCEIGTFLKLPQLVLLSVDPSFDLHMWKESEGSTRSYPMEVNIQVSLRSYFSVTDKYVDAMFMEYDRQPDLGTTDAQKLAVDAATTVHSGMMAVDSAVTGAASKVVSWTSSLVNMGKNLVKGE